MRTAERNNSQTKVILVLFLREKRTQEKSDLPSFLAQRPRTVPHTPPPWPSSAGWWIWCTAGGKIPHGLWTPRPCRASDSCHHQSSKHSVIEKKYIKIVFCWLAVSFNPHYPRHIEEESCVGKVRFRCTCTCTCLFCFAIVSEKRGKKKTKDTCLHHHKPGQEAGSKFLKLNCYFF